VIRTLHNGDLGDAIASMPAIRQLGGGIAIFTQKPNPRTFQARELLIPLYEAQDYIEAAYWMDVPQGIDYNFCTFRKQWIGGCNLAQMQARWVGLADPDMRPWIRATPSADSKGRVVVARSDRYHAQTRPFPWTKVAERYGDRLLFVGTHPEHMLFQEVAQRPVGRSIIENYQQLAELIAGSDLFIGNQSSPCWVAMGLGHPLVQETHDHIRDSIVPRDNAQFVLAGQIDWSKLPP